MKLTEAERCHPAKFSMSVIDLMGELLAKWLGPVDTHPWRILDPFAGIGRVELLRNEEDPRPEWRRWTVGLELERPWACNASAATVQESAKAIPFATGSFDAVCTSVVYMNRMRDDFVSRDDSERNTYTHKLRELTGDPTRKLHPDNTGRMNDRQYTAASQRHIGEMRRVLTPSGLLLLNVSNSFRSPEKGLQVEHATVERWLNWLTLAHFYIRAVVPVGTPRYGFGANYNARVEHEVVIVAQSRPNGMGW